MRRLAVLILTVLAVGAFARARADAVMTSGPMTKPWNGKRIGAC